jgi:hypothetical protein
MGRKWKQLRDFFAMRAHFGWAHALLNRLRHPKRPVLRHLVPAIDRVLHRMHINTRRLSTRFDAHHGTETNKRLPVPVSEDPHDETRWGCGPINHDFFKEIMRSIPVSLSPYTFVDIGSGKGAAVLMASEFPFKHLMGVELGADLIDIAKRNVDQFNTSTGKRLAPEWVRSDFFKWVVPKHHHQLFFFNNPLPEVLTLPAIQRLEQSLAEHPRPALLVFRKAPRSTGDYLHQSAFWKPLRLAPYWRIYQSVAV